MLNPLNGSHHVEIIEQIPGLSLWHGALDHSQQMALTEAIISAGIFGQGNQAMRFGNLGPHLDMLSTYIKESKVLPPCLSDRLPLFDQAIYNRYNKGEGLISHVDLAKFDDGIIVLSLLSSCCMTMKPVANPQQAMELGYSNGQPQRQQSDKDDHNSALDILLRPGDILILSGPARYLWEHGIAERDTDIVDGEAIVRGTRISVTLRKLLPV
ncbi:hypothetical protein BCR42DRAFT_329640 [Absidia repens]|uniref:Fe2OG dioxygenase domain-containing protein n=1 Tax=Absidia repens TaxID=90262 RepID=A0A1X2IDZ8_9FUNG|nr:hypothetical protein BCR42DRAFT_329640 [Absidia repens]